MAKQCKNCGNYLLDDEKFCTRCGTNVNAQTDIPAPDNNGAMGSAPVSVPVPAPSVQQTAARNTDDGSASMTLGSWIGTIILTTWFGLISIILLFVWGFGANVPKAKANYCKAMLVMMLIGVILSIIMIIFFVAAFAVVMDQNPEVFEELENAIESFSASFN